MSYGCSCSNVGAFIVMRGEQVKGDSDDINDDATLKDNPK